MPVFRIVYDEVPTGTIFGEGTPENPVIYVVDSATKTEDELVFRNGSVTRDHRWKLKFRPPTDEEKLMSDVMLT